MKIELRVPQIASLDLSAALDLIAQGKPSHPFNDDSLALLAELSDLLIHHPEARAYPDLVALGFGLRSAEIERLRTAFVHLPGSGRIVQPRGTVFQIAAGNVDTLFIHTWIFALLTGNRSVIRLPSKESHQSEFLCTTLNALLHQKPALRDSNHFMRYGHNKETTGALSAICDVRAIWGGDATVNAIRSLPLGPHAKELTFADRYSLAAIASKAYLTASPNAQHKLVRDFWNDTFWFDQLACSSPRLMVWCGSPEDNTVAAETFFAALESESTRRGVKIQPSTKMRKFLYACETAIEQPAVACLDQPHITVLDLENIKTLQREHCGGGLFMQYQTVSLSDIAPYLHRKDQTLVYFGFERPELSAFAQSLNGRALDRIVPIGQALTFSRFWDGYDLLTEFTRSVAVV